MEWTYNKYVIWEIYIICPLYGLSAGNKQNFIDQGGKLMKSEIISAVMIALTVILGMIGAMFLVKHTASSIEKTSDGDAREAKEAAQKVQEGNKDKSKMRRRIKI